MHLVGHSAGSILLGGLAAANQKAGGKPVTVLDLHDVGARLHDGLLSQELSAGDSRRQHQAVRDLTLTDRAEQDDDCANIYHKSLLYLVSHAFEKELRKPWFSDADGEPLLGMEKFLRKLPDRDLPKEWVLSPNAVPEGRPGAARATTHGGFDDDGATLKATLARVLGESAGKVEFAHHRSESAQRGQRQAIMQQTPGI